VGVVK